MNLILFLKFILIKILIFDFVNCVKKGDEKNIHKKQHDTKIHKVKDNGIQKDNVYVLHGAERKSYMKRNNITGNLN